MTPARRRPGFARRAIAASLALTLATGLLPSTPQALAADNGSSASGEPVSLNFVNAEIGGVIQAISKISGRNFIIDPRVKGTLNIVTARPVARHLTYSILLSALRLQGYAAVEGDGVTKIVPEADAKLHAVPVGKGKGAGGGDRLTTQVFNLKHESASQLVPVIRPLVSPNNTVTAYPGNNSLVVTDYAENVGRIAQIVESIDVPQGDMRVIPLQHASALDLAQTVTRLLADGVAGTTAGVAGGGVGGDASQRISVIGDPRTNSLLVRSENPSKLNAVRQLVANLDKPGAAGNIHVVYLKNAEAVKVAQTLRAVISGEAGSLGQNPTGTAGSSFAPTQAGTTTGSTTGTMGATPSFSSQTGNTGATGNGIVQADPMTNSLIITAPEAIYNNLRKVIDQLDKRRAQVYVEALITEVSTEKAAEIGIQWQAGKVGSTTAYGGTSFGSSGNNILNLAAGLATTLPGNGLNLILGSGTVSVGGKEIANLNMLARFLESDTKANILSTPNLVTLDNEEAKIVVGQNLPFVTGSYTNTGSSSTSVTPFQTYERQDVGLTLKVRPQITQGGVVRVQIYQETSTVQSGTASNTAGPTTNKRALESHVLVDDGNIIALGGLIEDDYGSGDDKVPVLGDLPVLGNLFRYETRKRKKTQLMVFLRPRIVRDSADYERYTQDRYEQLLGTQQQFARDQRGLIPESEPPRLPALQEPAP